MNTTPLEDNRAPERQRMVQEQIVARGINDERVLDTLRRVPRHRFVSPGTDAFRLAYADTAQRIAEDQTISQPYIVALMTEALDLTGNDHVLEIGAGSGYQTAVLAELARSVVAIERHSTLAIQAKQTLDALGYRNIQLSVGDGSRGWSAFAPYDAILVAANAPKISPALVSQLKPGGRLILPVGSEQGEQRLVRVTRELNGNLTTQDYGQVAFVPLVGASGFGFLDDLGDMDF